MASRNTQQRDQFVWLSSESNRSTSPSYCAYLACMALLSWLAYVGVSGSGWAVAQGNLVALQCIYYFVLALHIVRRVCRSPSRNLLAPDVVFVVLYTLFHLGYVTLYTLGVLRYDREVFYFPSAAAQTLHVVNIGLIAFLLGYELRFPWSNRTAPCVSLPLSVPHQRWLTIGVSGIAFGIALRLMGYYFIGFGNIATHGYVALQDTERVADVSSLGPQLFRQAGRVISIGMITYAAASALRYGRLFHSSGAFVLAGVATVIFLLEGNRGPLLITVVPLLLIRHYLVRPVRSSVLTGMGLLFLMLFPAIAAVRHEAFRPARMITEYRHIKDTAALRWHEFFREFGGSFVTANVTVHEVPEREPYWRGRSWLDATSGAIPFLQGLLWRQGWLHVAPSKWVTSTYWGEERAGRAFTVAAEGYLNLGYAGVVLELMAMGIAVRMLFVFLSRKPSIVRAVVFFGVFPLLLSVIRNHLNIATGQVVQLMILAWILNKACGQQSVAWVRYRHYLSPHPPKLSTTRDLPS